MYNIRYIIFLLSFFVASCNFEYTDNLLKEPEFDLPYEDTSIFVGTYTNVSYANITIGTQDYLTSRFLVFPQSNSLQPFFNWPAVTITNKESVLVLCTNSEILGGDGQMDIVLARKEKKSDFWVIKKLFQTDNIRGKAMCPTFVIDRDTGRIFLFANHIKDINNPDEVDQVYKYSDDDGITWSKEISIKKGWESFYNQSYSEFSLFENDQVAQTEDYESLWYKFFNKFTATPFDKNNLICISCGPNGLSLGNGLLLLTAAVIVNGVWRSALLIRENGIWRFSSPTLHSGDTESTVYLDNKNHIVVDCRTLTTNRRKYYYDLSKDVFIETIPSNIGSYVRIHTEIVNDNGLFYMCYPDSQDDTRKNITFYGSKDGINWKKIFLVYPSYPSNYGYTSVALKNKKLLICYETQNGVFVQDITECRDAIREQILKE